MKPVKNSKAVHYHIQQTQLLIPVVSVATSLAFGNHFSQIHEFWSVCGYRQKQLPEIEDCSEQSCGDDLLIALPVPEHCKIRPAAAVNELNTGG